MHTQNRKLLRKQDLLTIIIILLIGAVCFAVVKIISQKGARAVISVDRKTISEHTLDNDCEITLKEAEGAVIEIENRQIRVRSSDCPDKICVNTGYISKEGEKIVCLPKKLIIEVKAD